MKNILITGSEGYIGQALVRQLAENHHVVGIDIRPTSQFKHANYHYFPLDVRSNEMAALMQRYAIQQVVHLASVMNPGKDEARDYDIDVNGTVNVLNACAKANVEQIIVTSSGAAYGYYADNPAWLSESDPLRGHPAFSYSRHKLLIEQQLENFKRHHPQIKQLILRPGTVLGQHTDNLITRLFHKPRLLKIAGSESPFVFIWDQDVINIILQGLARQSEGAFNLAGDGALSVTQLANIMSKPLLTLPSWLLSGLLAIGRALKISPYGPEQLDFLRYRPVLSNKALKHEFGYTPQMTSEQAFRYYARHNGLIP